MQPDRVDPVTPEEWQNAVDAAHACLLIDSARHYGLIEGGPAVDADRCELMLSLGENQGFTPSADALERFLAAINATVK